MFSPEALAAAGAAGAAGGAEAPAAPPDTGKMIDLKDKIEKIGCYAKNQASGFPFTNLFIGDTRLGCKSDADEQLIIHIAFQEFVKIHSIKLTEFNNGINPEDNPTKVHLYVNRENLGFEDAEDIDPTQTLELTTEDLRENAEPIALKFVRFQRVKSLTFFIEDNGGGDITALGALKLLGRTVATTNMNEFKKQG